jgi:hypothetical protein
MINGLPNGNRDSLPTALLRFFIIIQFIGIRFALRRPTSVGASQRTAQGRQSRRQTQWLRQLHQGWQALLLVIAASTNPEAARSTSIV